MRHHVGKQWTLRGEEEEKARPENVGRCETLSTLQWYRGARKRTKGPSFPHFKKASLIEKDSPLFYIIRRLCSV